MDTTVADPLHGALLGGRYRVVGWLARGGMATVYVARDERLERTVAVKVIHPDRAADPRFLTWLADEAKTVAKLTHPNVVAVYDQGVHDGAPFVVMEYVRGRTLREMINERRRFDPAEALSIIEQVLSALSAAHRAGLVHRDVKPENILIALAPNGTGDLADAVVKVADFGLARASHVVTANGEEHVLATAEYVAPETVAQRDVDTRADVYSVGVVLYEMLTGRPPFTGASPAAVAWRHVEQDVPPPSWAVPALPVATDRLVSTLTRRDPRHRPRDASAALSLVRTAQDELRSEAAARALEHPTVVVPSVDNRPSWARLPAPDRSGNADQGWFQHTGRRLATAIRSDALRGGWRSARDRVGLMRRTEQGRRQLVIALIVIGALLLAGGWWAGFGRYTQAPSLVALTKANAVAEASRLGFSVSFAAGRYAENVPIDTVLTQQPGVGERIARGGTVTLVLSLGPERYVVPDVAGQAVDVATAAVKEHFVVALVNGYSDTLPVNYVVGTDPAAGTPLKPNATVKLIVAKGPNPVHVPSVIGKQLGDAQSQLEALGFTVEVQRRDDETKPRDQVLDQNPAAGQGLANAKGVKVVITVANGPPGPVMPQVVGARCTDAIDQLGALGLSVNVNGNAFERFFWTVKEQRPDPGQVLTAGQVVELKCGG